MLHKPTFSAKTQLDEDSVGPGFLPNNNPISRGCTPKVKHLKMSYSMEQQKMVKSHKVSDNTKAFFFKIEEMSQVKWTQDISYYHSSICL